MLFKAVNDMKTGIENVQSGIGHAVKNPLHMVGNHNSLEVIGKNASDNMKLGSKALPVVGECKDIFEGIAHGDLQKVAMSGSLLSLYAFSASGAVTNTNVKLGINSISSGTLVSHAAALGTANNMMKNSGGAETSVNTL